VRHPRFAVAPRRRPPSPVFRPTPAPKTTVPDRRKVPADGRADAAPPSTYYCWLVLDGVLADVVVSGAAVSAGRVEPPAGNAIASRQRVEAVVRAELQRRRALAGERWAVSIATRVSSVRLHPRDERR
jgi:hypothetical protein